MQNNTTRSMLPRNEAKRLRLPPAGAQRPAAYAR